MHVNASYQFAVSLVQQRRYSEAAPLLSQICGTGSADLTSWVMLGLCLLGLNKTAQLMGLIELRHRQANDGMKLLNDCLLMAQQWPDRTPVRRMIDQIPENSALVVIGRYVSGLMHAQDGEVDRGLAQVIEAARLTGVLPEELAREPYVKTIAVEGALLGSFADVARFAAESPSRLFTKLGVQPEATFVGCVAHDPTEPCVFLSSCDERYLDRFGETVVRALDATGARTIYHLHVVDPSPLLGDKIARLQRLCSGLALRYSTEVYAGKDDGYTRAEYYACSRLIRLPEIMEHYERDIFMWDVDMNGIRDLRALLGAMEGFDLGYFHMSNTRLTLAAHLATAYFSNTEAMRQCAGVIRNYILAKWATSPFWLLDQAAVYCSSQYLAAGTPSFRIRDFGVAPGGAFCEHIDVASSAEEKQRMRKVAGKQAA